MKNYRVEYWIQETTESGYWAKSKLYSYEEAYAILTVYVKVYSEARIIQEDPEL